MTNTDVTTALQELEQLKKTNEANTARIKELEELNTKLTADLESKDKEVVTLQASLYRNLSTTKTPEQPEHHDFATDYRKMIKENSKG